jgi:hypothetical protein
MTTTEFASILMASRIDMHIAHLQTTKYSDHMALNDFYTDIVDLTDRFIESYQGKYELLKGYKITYVEGVDPLKYLQNLREQCLEYRKEIEDGYLQQIIDEIIELISSVTYKIKYLKN